MFAERNVRDAERRVALQKVRVHERWRGLRSRGRDALVSPATLTALVLAGGVAGWRSVRRPDRSVRRSDAAYPARSVLRSVTAGLLRTVAAIAVEKALKGAMADHFGETRPPAET